MMMKKTIVVLTAIALSACSSIKSIESPDKGTACVDGLTYFMPKKDFLVTITVEEKKITKVALGTTSSYPDLSTQYILRYTRNLFGKNTLDVGVNEAGLLTSTNSTTVSNVADVFKNLAATAGMLGPLVGLKKAGDVAEPCTNDGDHSFVFDAPGGPYSACCMTITIKRIEDSISKALDPKTKKSDSASVVPHSKKANKEYSGIFYRQNIPYLITAAGNGFHSASVVFSPSESKIHFLPVSTTMLSNNQADFGFVEGIPTKYKQETESELLVLFKLPADIISTYFTGIGTVFDSFKSKYQKEGDVLTESLKLELAKKKYDACISAIKAGDSKLIQELGCP